MSGLESNDLSNDVANDEAIPIEDELDLEREIDFDNLEISFSVEEQSFIDDEVAFVGIKSFKKNKNTDAKTKVGNTMRSIPEEEETVGSMDLPLEIFRPTKELKAAGGNETGAEVASGSRTLIEKQIAEKEEEEEDIDKYYERWNPMKDHYYDPMNLAIKASDAAGFALLRENTPQECMKMEDVLCRFHDGIRDKCWKSHCPNYHPIYGSKDYDRVHETKITREAIRYFLQLDEKDVAPKGALMEVTVEHIKHPWKFFVSCCEGEFGCVCDKKKKDIPNDMETRRRLETRLTEEMLNGMKYMKTRCTDYVEFQLVAVKRSVNENIVFCRGVILQTTTDIKEFEKSSIPVQLLDTGEKLMVKFTDICNLPSKYVTMFPTLAHQCCLHGISPVSPLWTEEATAYFKELVLGKKCILEVKKTRQVLPDSPLRLFEDDDPYQVELRIPLPDAVTGEERFQSVSDLLAKFYHGVLWNIAPFRPSIGKRFSKEMFSLFCNSVYSPKDLEEIYRNENKRMLMYKMRDDD